MGKKSIVFSLLDSPAFGGAEQYIFSNLQFLSKNGYYILLATNNDRVKKEILLRLRKHEKNFRIIKAPYRLDAIGNIKGLIKYFISLPKALLFIFLTIINLKKNYNEVICLWAGFSDRLSFTPIAKALKCKIIWIELGPLDGIFKRNFGIPKILYNTTSKFADKLITISEHVKKSILENTGFWNKNIKLIYPGTKLFSANQIKNYQQKSKGNKTRIIGTIARLAKETEIDVLIKAFALYLKKTKNRNILLLIIGDGPEKKDFENLGIKLDIEKYLRFTGFVTEEQKRILLSSFYFFIFPRAWELEGFGLTTIEAMSLGIPVLTSDFGPQKEIVENNKEGLRYKPHDSFDMALKIEEMLHLNPAQRNKMKYNALEKVKKFSESKSHKLLLSEIRKIT